MFTRSSLVEAPLVLLGLMLVFAFMLQAIVVDGSDFLVAHHDPYKASSLETLIVFLSLLYALLVLIAGRLEAISKKHLWRIIGLFFLLLIIFSFLTHPTRSQDSLHTLLLIKGFTAYGINPYISSGQFLQSDTWAYPVRDWLTFPFVYGPFYALLVTAVTYIFSILSQALAALRFLQLLAIIGTGYFLVRIYQKSTVQRSLPVLLLLFLWNPFLIQTGLIDAHNDVFVMLAIAGSYYFLLTQEYFKSGSMLMLGGLIKYISIVLLPVPIIISFLNSPRKDWLRLLLLWLFFLAVWLLITCIVVLPFGGMTPLRSALAYQTGYGQLSEYLPGTAIVLRFISISSETLRLVGFLIALLLASFLAYIKKPLAAYIIPITFILFFTTPWFQPWYVLWIYPLLFLTLPNMPLTVLTVFLIATPEFFHPLPASTLFLAGLSWYYAMKMFYRASRIFLYSILEKRRVF